MMDAADAARRRELQRRAFAPGGRLTADEAAELRALDERGRMPAAQATVAPAPLGAPQAEAAPLVVDPVVPPAPAAPAVPHPRFDPAPEAARPIAAADAGPDAESHHAPTPDRASGGARPMNGAHDGRRRWMLPLVAALAVLLGLGAGWLAFGREAAPVMTAKQSEMLAALETTGDYDPGSIRLLGEKYAVSVWAATQRASTTSCVIITHEEKTAPACTHTEKIEAADPQEPLQASMQYTEGGEDYTLWAAYVEDLTGRLRVIVQRYASSEEWDWRSQFSEEELATVALFEDGGFDGQYLQIVGYDDTVPVWLYQADRTCLLVQREEDSYTEGCGELVFDSGQTLDLAVPGAIYSVHATSNRGPVLTIIRQTPSITCDVDSGYCASVDDTTGDLG